MKNEFPYKSSKDFIARSSCTVVVYEIGQIIFSATTFILYYLIVTEICISTSILDEFPELHVHDNDLNLHPGK